MPRIFRSGRMCDYRDSCLLASMAALGAVHTKRIFPFHLLIVFYVNPLDGHVLSSRSHLTSFAESHTFLFAFIICCVKLK